MLYIYVASTKRGKIKKGTIDSESLEAARESLSKQGLLVISLEEKKKSIWQMPISTLISLFWVGSLEKLMFTKHLSIMLRSGVDIIDALKALQEQTSSLKLKKILKETISLVSAGQKLSDSLARYPSVFSELYVSTVRAGEAGGTLDKNLEYLADQMSKDYNLKRKIKSALAYPTVVLVAAVVVSLFLAIFILPKITKLLKALTVPLPLTTRALLWTADFLEKYGLLTIIILILLVFLIKWLFRLKPVKAYFERLILQLPIIGRINQNINLARFSRRLGSLLRSGLPITSALKVASHTLDNVFYQKVLIKIQNDIQRGGTLASLLERHRNLFPLTVCQMVATGEETGRLEETLFYLAEFYEAEVDTSLKGLSTLIEPILLVFIGLLVGGVALAIISPIYEVVGHLGR